MKRNILVLLSCLLLPALALAQSSTSRTVSALLWNHSEKAIDVHVHLKNLPTDGKVRRYLLNTADRAFDDTARLQAQPMQKVSKGEGLSSFRLEPWGLTMISIAKF